MRVAVLVEEFIDRVSNRSVEVPAENMRQVWFRRLSFEHSD